MFNESQQTPLAFLAAWMVYTKNRTYHRFADGLFFSLRPHIVSCDDLVDDKRSFLHQLAEFRQIMVVYLRGPGQGLCLIILLHLHREEQVFYYIPGEVAIGIQKILLCHNSLPILSR